jgi:lipoprotein-releasing system permease protein
MYVFLLAWRYATSRWFNLIAVVVMALTLMASLTVIGVIDGMLVDLERRVSDLGEQVSVRLEYPSPLSAIEKMAPVAGVRGFSPQVVSYALIAKNNFGAEPALAYGIDLAAEAKLSSLPQHLQDLSLNENNPQWLPPDAGRRDLPAIFVGNILAESLGVYAGDIVTLSYAPTGANEIRQRDFYVASLFSSGSAIKDERGFYLPLTVAQEIFLSPAEAETGAVTSLSFFLDNPDAADDAMKRAIQQSVANAAGATTYAQTWKERWRSIYEGMAYENMLNEVVLFFMNLMAGCSVFAVMATLVSRKVRDVGLLRCLGAGRGQTVSVFVIVGLIIGIVGAGTGVIAGYAVGLNINELWKFFTGFELYPPRMFGHTIETVIFPHKVALYAGVTVLISVIAALYPALSAGLREPLAALRDE